ncbi:MAG: helix-turn-helix transcriptional regulator [Oscillospiraceae bacterium]|nr:helix-turn-helix transcriptional regulator [Oscillospiraceae bacterium]
MDTLRIGQYIQFLRKSAGLTQKELAEKLGVSFQAVSKWENGDALPDTGLILDLCDLLGTTADKLLSGGVLVTRGRRPMSVRDVIDAFRKFEEIGQVFGPGSTFFAGMVEGINSRMNMDILSALRDHREVLYAEALIQGILEGRTVDMDEVEALLTNEKMISLIRRYAEKA